MAANNISPDIISALPPAPNLARFINEAAYGYRYVAPYVSRLPEGAHILEIGSGPCILLAQLAKDFPQLHFAGVEPVAAGFAFYADSIKAMRQSYAFDLTQDGYEAFPTGQKFDLIFLVNVFHHLPDWRHFLRFVKSSLAENGTCLILCPNYGFPYESHFGIPSLWNKRLTHIVFRDHIARFEQSNDRAGLWQSLNFVTWLQGWAEIRKLDMEVVFHSEIVTDLIDRFDNDLEFARRQKLLSPVAKLLKRSKLLCMLRLPVFWGIHPYMFLEINCKKGKS